MNKFLALLFFSTILLQSCDDGDIIITTFNFDEAELESCGTLGNYVFYKVNPEALESLSLKLGVTDSLYRTAETKNYVLNGTTNFVNYRTYDGDLGTTYFCSSIPPTSPNVTVDYLAAAGTAEFVTTFIYEDNDLVPEEEEAAGDTDGDGLPNIYDFDDDGDNVPTARELDTENTDGDDNPFTNPKDTDGDGTPDYLDDDDDGDSVLTRDEDENRNLDPMDDVTDTSIGPDYLNPAVAISHEITEYRQHTYKIFKSVKITLKNLVLENGEETITQETLIMGNIENVETRDKTKKPVF